MSNDSIQQHNLSSLYLFSKQAFVCHVIYSLCQQVQASNINIVNKAVSLQDPYLWTGSDVRIREPDMPNIHFAVAFKGASWSDPDSVALMVMQVSPRTVLLQSCCTQHTTF